MVEEAEGRTTQSAQEAEVSTSQLAALMVRLVSSEIPLVIVSMVCVLVATLLDNMIPDVQVSPRKNALHPRNMPRFSARSLQMMELPPR